MPLQQLPLLRRQGAAHALFIWLRIDARAVAAVIVDFIGRSSPKFPSPTTAPSRRRLARFARFRGATLPFVHHRSAECAPPFRASLLADEPPGSVSGRP